MKKNFTFMTIPIFFTLILTACGTSNATQTGTNGNSDASSNTPLPLAMQLVVGTFKLEGTANAVTAQEAAKLIPLWQVYKDLSVSSSAAPQEVEALAEQIQSTMTSEQVQAITDLKLTRRDIFQTLQDLGIASTDRPTASGTPRAGGGGGGFPGGGGGGGGGVFPGGGGGGGQNLTLQQVATLQARRAQNGGSNGSSGQFNRIPPPLYDALIKLLQSKK
jgi:hypothetical protein